MIGCPNAGTDGTYGGSSEEGKIPITTSSEEAKKEYLQGRDLAENLRLQDSLQQEVHLISAVTGQSLHQLVGSIAITLQSQREAALPAWRLACELCDDPDCEHQLRATSANRPTTT